MRLFKRVFAVVVSLALLAWIFAQGQWTELGEALTSLPLGTVLIAALGFALSYVLRALRVWDEFRHGGEGRFGACLRIVLMHNAMVNIVPFRGGEAAFPLLLRQTFGTPLGRAVASLFWFRLQDAFVVLCLALLVWPGLSPAVRALGVGSAVALAVWLPRWARRAHDWHDGSPWHARLARVRDAFADSTRHARFGWLWTISNWSVKLAAQAWLLSVVVDRAVTIGAAGALGAELARHPADSGCGRLWHVRGRRRGGDAAARRRRRIGSAGGIGASSVCHRVRQPGRCTGMVVHPRARATDTLRTLK